MLLSKRKCIGAAVLIFLLLCSYSLHSEEKQTIEKESGELSSVQNVKYYSLEEKQHLIMNYTLNISYQASPTPELSYTVPPLIHFIWIGSNMSQDYLDNIVTWAGNNRHYQVFLWVDNYTSIDFGATDFSVKNVTKEIQSFSSKDIILAEPLLVCKADIIRYEIIHKYGGIYTDADSLSVQPLGPVFLHSFVSVMSSPPQYVQNCIFGFPASSHFMKYVLALVREHFTLAKINKMEVSVKYGPVFFTTAFVRFGDNNIHVIDGNYVLEASGDSVVVQLFDGNWWNKNNEEKEERDLARFLINRDKINLENFIEDLQYEVEMDESYEKMF